MAESDFHAALYEIIRNNKNTAPDGNGFDVISHLPATNGSITSIQDIVTRWVGDRLKKHIRIYIKHPCDAAKIERYLRQHEQIKRYTLQGTEAAVCVSITFKR